jgi:hypothetical protein
MMTSTVDTSIQRRRPCWARGDAAAAAEPAARDGVAAGPPARRAAAARAAEPRARLSAAPSAGEAQGREAQGEGGNEFLHVVVSLVATSERVLAGLARADADDLFQRRNEDLAVADLAGAARPRRPR